jgi:hypothetical protein
MKWASEHQKVVIDVAESNEGIDKSIGGHLCSQRCKKQAKITLD